MVNDDERSFALAINSFAGNLIGEYCISLLSALLYSHGYRTVYTEGRTGSWISYGGLSILDILQGIRVAVP